MSVGHEKCGSGPITNILLNKSSPRQIKVLHHNMQSIARLRYEAGTPLVPFVRVSPLEPSKVPAYAGTFV